MSARRTTSARRPAGPPADTAPRRAAWASPALRADRGATAADAATERTPGRSAVRATGARSTASVQTGGGKPSPGGRSTTPAGIRVTGEGS
ncbi:hypothetical protein ABZZ20_22015 [Streptomyces sp. NPDC006430]|uniref:hypothetical protein n=1 Tax=Streptomyces sp. NPDC006430 TaxID=3154299 RepID=UPI00339F728D